MADDAPKSDAAQPGRALDVGAMDIGQLVAQHLEVLYRYAFRLTGSVPDAEDLTQQTFLVAQQKLHQLREEESVRGWLFTVLRNCYLKGFRKPVPLPAAALEFDVELIPCRESAEPLGGVLDSELLQQALDQLSDEFKLVVTMFYFEERSYREIADLLQLPIGTVMSRLSRAKASLRRRLQPMCEAPVEASRAADKTPPAERSLAKRWS
jgi:RNA polymerase sigma-70 factor (ECF subfamily)